MPEALTYDLEFWNDNHGLQPGDEVSVGLQSERRDDLTYILEGEVAEVENQTVSVTGVSLPTLKRCLPARLDIVFQQVSLR